MQQHFSAYDIYTLGALRHLFFLAAIVAFNSRDAHAQAWVGAKRGLWAALDYEFSRSTSIVESADLKIDNEPIIAHALILRLEFVPIKKLAVGVQLPFLMTKYQGMGTLFPRHGRYDDGKLHSTLQDFRLSTRYQVVEEPLALAPHIAVTIPTMDYETLGYANAGRGLKQLHFGLSAGRFIASQLYAHALYEFTWSERYDATVETKTIGQNRSDLAITVGYLLLDSKLELNLGGNFRFPHGGIDFLDFNTLSTEIQDNHDPLLRESFILAGAGVAYQITDTLRASLLGRLYVRGTNTRNANSVGVGISWDIM